MYIVKSLKYEEYSDYPIGEKVRKFKTLRYAKNYALNYLKEGEPFGIYHNGKEIFNDGMEV
jgi:hypothetical protein